MEFISFLKEVKNCKIAKHNESQSAKYPREGAIMRVIMLSAFIFILLQSLTYQQPLRMLREKIIEQAYVNKKIMFHKKFYKLVRLAREDFDKKKFLADYHMVFLKLYADQT